jgi:hypothetical protein
MKYLTILILLISFQSYGQDDCIFDLKTQTDEFIKSIAEFSNYVWNDSTKTGTITLDNGERLIATRGGCDHFGISGQWIQENNKHSIEELDYWFDKGKWMSKRLMSEVDYSALKEMILNENFELNVDNNKLFVLFTAHTYSEWYLVVEFDEEKSAIIETGYYFN